MDVIDFKKLNKLPYITRRMYVIKNICESRGVDLEYLFSLFNLYDKKNRGKWFWQKAAFTGALKDSYDSFDAEINKIVIDLKQADERKTKEQIKAASDVLDKLLVNIEINCNVDRKRDFNYIKENLGENFKKLIIDSLYRKFK